VTDQFREAAIAAISEHKREMSRERYIPTSDTIADAVIAALLPKFVEAAVAAIEEVPIPYDFQYEAIEGAIEAVRSLVGEEDA